MGREATQFKKGESGNPQGRPPGSRNAVSEQFLKDLYLVWNKKGLEALNNMADRRPNEFVRAVAQVLPKNFQVTVDTDQVNWVINASPKRITVEDWKAEHGIK